MRRTAAEQLAMAQEARRLAKASANPKVRAAFERLAQECERAIERAKPAAGAGGQGRGEAAAA